MHISTMWATGCRLAVR